MLLGLTHKELSMVEGNDMVLPGLHEKLLQPGWAGELDPPEFALVKAQLQQSPSLKRRWGFRPSAKRLSEAHIRSVAMNGLQRKAKR